MLDRIAASSPSADDVCARAEACCRVAMPLLGGECDVDFQLGDRHAITCERSMRGMGILLTDTHHEIPGACAER